MELNHFDKNGNAVMVDVSDKPVTHRTAIATGSIQVSPEIMAAVKSGNVKKVMYLVWPVWQVSWV